MWRIRVNQLYSEVGGLISGAEVVFTTPGGHTRKIEGKISGSQRFGYEFTMPGGRGELKTEHHDRVVLGFEVLNITEDEHETSDTQPG